MTIVCSQVFFFKEDEDSLSEGVGLQTILLKDSYSPFWLMVYIRERQIMHVSPAPRPSILLDWKHTQQGTIILVRDTGMVGVTALQKETSSEKQILTAFPPAVRCRMWLFNSMPSSSWTVILTQLITPSFSMQVLHLYSRQNTHLIILL